jgi:hypothetical protein
VFENKVLKMIFGPKKDEVAEVWRKLLNKELHDLYSSSSINRVIKSRMMRWDGACNTNGVRRGTSIDCWWESQRERGR